MDDEYIVPVYAVFDDLAKAFLEPVKYNPKMTVAEIMTVAVVAARYFNNNHERALIMMYQTGYIAPARRLSVSRFKMSLSITTMAHYSCSLEELCR